MLFCWGPYGVLAFYAAIENANLVSPKLRMVRTAKGMHTQKKTCSIIETIVCFYIAVQLI